MILLLLLMGLLAGLLGSLTGLGGAVLLLPALTIFLKIPFEHAAGATLLAIIATSSGAASAYLRERLANIRIGISLEGASTLGGLLGALLAAIIFRAHLQAYLFLLFGLVLLSAILSRPRQNWITPTPDRSTERFDLRGSYYDQLEKCHLHYFGIRWLPTATIMVGAGLISGLLGIGSGTINVMALNRMMRLPLKVSTATSNFMIGVTALASAVIYWRLGYVDPTLAGPTAVGVLAGALLGARLLPRLKDRRVLWIFNVIVIVTAIQMIVKGVHAL
jgi:uncharacterized protein